MKKNVHNKDTTGIRRPLRISAALIRKEMGMSVVVILGVPWDNHFISGESLINDPIFDIDILHQKIYMVKMGGVLRLELWIWYAYFQCISFTFRFKNKLQKF